MKYKPLRKEIHSLQGKITSNVNEMTGQELWKLGAKLACLAEKTKEFGMMRMTLKNDIETRTGV